MDKSFEENIFELYISMRKEVLDADGFRYETTDEYINSDDFKTGFLAGIKVMSALGFFKRG